jgi:1-acyl-sn-glycerol-3-phosphate acyltransferase
MRAPTLRVPRRDLRRLAPLERLALRVGRIFNESRDLKDVTHLYNELVTSRWIGFLGTDRLRVAGLDKVKAMRPDRGVLLAANHRSFFDQFVLGTYLNSQVDWSERFFFPVRSKFFYDHPLGVIVNAVMSSMSMYPPVFRENEKRGVTRAGLDFLAAQLARPGVVVGIHPEGTRGKGPDPYELLPAEAGFGRVVLEGKPIVLPAFINGLGNDFMKEITSSYAGKAPPIGIVFGDPVDLAEFEGVDPHRVRNQIQVARKVVAEITKLGAIERGLRAEGSR